MLELEKLFILHTHIYIYVHTVTRHKWIKSSRNLRLEVYANSCIYDWLNYNCIEGSWFKLLFSAILSSHENTAGRSTTWPLPHLVVVAVWGQRFQAFTERRCNHTFLNVLKLLYFYICSDTSHGITITKKVLKIFMKNKTRLISALSQINYPEVWK